MEAEQDMDVNPTLSAISVAPALTRAAEQSAVTPDTDELRRRILELILESSQPLPPSALWVRFGSVQSVRRLLCQPAELLSKLGQHFTADQLLAARVAVQTQSGELEVSKLLATDKAFLIRGDATGPAVDDLVSHGGKLSSGTSEWREFAAQSSDENSKHATPLVLCANDAELYVFAQLGICCSPLADVDRLTGKQVRALFENRHKHAQQSRYQIVLLGWQPGTLVNAPSAKNLAAIRHVAAIQRIYGFDPHTVFSVWLPSAAQLTRIRRAHSFGDREVVADEFRSSLRKSLCAPADALALLAGRKPATWAKARSTLESVIERSSLAPRVAETGLALEKLERAYHDQVVVPLETAVGKTGLDALLSMMAVDLATLWYQDLDLVRAARRVIAGHFPAYAKRIDDAALNRKLRLVSEAVKLARVKF